MGEYFLDSPADYRLMNQTGVRQFRYPDESTHNAIWDSNVSPEGRLYFALASEICTSEYVHLCEYDYPSNTVSECFSVKDVILPSDRTIRASKFHSSICFMPDGKMVMTTHTTDKAPAHPTWMPEAYFHHIWEGYPGSQIIVYDPRTGEAKNLGTPVPRESIYGSIYEPAHNALFFTGIFRGHLYRYSFDEKTVKDFGQVSENYSFRLTLGPDGNIYGASKSGYVYKVDTETLEITDMDYRLEHNVQEYKRDFTNISIGRVGPDGRLYFAVMYGQSIIALDTKTGKFEDMGHYLPTRRYINGENRNGIFGMDFDSNGVLWYVVSSRNDGRDGLEYGLPASLFRWDVARGGKPQWAGLCGTPERVGCWVSEVCISRDDILYAVGSNHGLDGPDITAVDLRAFVPEMDKLGGNTGDRYYIEDDPRSVEMAKKIKAEEEISEANPFAVPYPLAGAPATLWRTVAPDNSAVTRLWWEGTRLYGSCAGGRFNVNIKDGTLAFYDNIIEPEPAAIPQVKDLPYYPGRQYKAVAVASAMLTDGKTVVGTEDGMLAVVGEQVYGLGPAVYNGPVRSLSTAPDGVVYGVGGDRDEMGMLFTYDTVRGLRWIGHVLTDDDTDGAHISVNCPVLNVCAVSPDGAYLAIGSGDRLGTVVVYEL